MYSLRFVCQCGVSFQTMEQDSVVGSNRWCGSCGKYTSRCVSALDLHPKETKVSGNGE